MIILAAHKNYSDLNFFKYTVNRNSVFRKLEALDFGYIPDKLFGRNEAIKTLIFTFRRIIFEKNLTTNCLLIGPAGSGKTTIAQFFMNNFREIALGDIPNFHTEYLNCIEFRSKNAIIKHLVKKFCHSNGKGLGAEEFWLILLKQLIYTKTYIFVVLDEINYLSQNNLIQILNLSETYGHQNVRLSFLLISREKEWKKYETQELSQRIHEIIKLNPYTFEEACHILTKRCELVFNDNIIKNETIQELARIVVNTENMRYGIEYLRRLGIYADKEKSTTITPNMLKEIPEIPYYKFIEIIEMLRIPELLAYTGVLYTLTTSETTTVEKSYMEYNRLCEIYNKKACHRHTFGRYIRTLAKFKLIVKELKHYPIPGGGYDEISLPYDLNGIKKEVENYLSQKLS